MSLYAADVSATATPGLDPPRADFIFIARQSTRDRGISSITQHRRQTMQQRPPGCLVGCVSTIALLLLLPSEERRPPCQTFLPTEATVEDARCLIYNPLEPDCSLQVR